VCSSGGTAAGNSTVGIFTLGVQPFVGNISTRNKYTYSGDVVGAATAATSVCWPSAAGNGTRGIFTAGGSGSATQRYTYSGDTVAVGGALTSGTRFGSAASNGILGVTV
jgi:hypothetical protein